MPTYEYECNACGHRLDHFQSIKDAPLRKCPKCGKLRLKRLIGAGAGVIFKGSGFYTTDYRSPAYHSAKNGDSAPKPESKPDSKGDSKAETCGQPACGADACQPAPAPAKKPKTRK